ncbi:PREDICTED: nucleoporin Nup43-like isoform X2 [Priapulus caudatus]|uniref:Nucleoporin Nup43-like isoform X2 n=1 Tax=Priapulus caudatus TaxID=37621 RepID=A0ABM1EZ04_PRICU|nr:PREDICTED: nucleoporin Nup43-like isoform X2 [Priapulus caudatus]
MEGIYVKYVNQKENRVGLWTLSPSRRDDDGTDVDPSPLAVPGEMRSLCSVAHRGDVTDLLYLKNDLILAASSTGNVTLYKHHQRSETLSVQISYERLHRCPRRRSPCTGLAHRDGEVVTVGEDGRINLLDIGQQAVVRCLDEADSCAINAVAYTRQNEIAATNSTGQLRTWDLRQPGDGATRNLHMTGERLPLNCIDRHPTQPHVIATGGQHGMLYVWDLRQERSPTLLSAHSSDIWEVKFHPTHPDNLFTCSEDGSTWHWDASFVKAALQAGKNFRRFLKSSRWLTIYSWNSSGFNCISVKEILQ